MLGDAAVMLDVWAPIPLLRRIDAPQPATKRPLSIRHITVEFEARKYARRVEWGEI